MKSKLLLLIRILVFFLVILSCKPSTEKKVTFNNIGLANKPIIKSIEEAQQLHTVSKKRNIDSLHSKLLLELVKFSYKKKKWNAFHQYRLEHLKNKSLKKVLKVNAKILDYSGAFFRHQNRQDSAYYYYYKAFKSYELLKDSLAAGKMLLNMAIIQKNTKDYTGSQSSSFKALKCFLAVNNKRRVASVYNNLGIVYKHLEDFDGAIKYHSKAYSIRKNLTQNNVLKIHSLNNIGNIYKAKKNYTKAIFYYAKALSNDSLLNKQPKIKAMLLDNFAHAKFLDTQFEELPSLYFKALAIRKTINDVPGQIMSNLHIGTYYKITGKKEIAKKYLEEAKKFSKSIQYPRDEIEVSRTLIALYSDKKGIKIAERIIYLQDSIQKVEKKVKEQFSRVRYETLEKEKKILEQEQRLQKNELQISRRTNYLLICLAIILLAILLLSFLWLKKYKKTQKFKFGFSKYLQEKYGLTPKNLEFWEELIKGHTQEELAALLHLSLNGVKSRRKALFTKIKFANKNAGRFDKTKATLLYKNELDSFKNNNTTAS